MEVSWNEVPCDSRNGDIISYQYAFNLKGNKYQNPMMTTIGRRVSKSGLQCAAEYTFSVAGVTNAGVGESSTYAWRTNTTGMYDILYFQIIIVKVKNFKFIIFVTLKTNIKSLK